MKCTEVDYLAPLYWSGELDTEATIEIDQHLQECSACAHEFVLQKECDEMLREAVLANPFDDSEIQHKVRKQIIPVQVFAWHGVRLWIPTSGLAAIVLVAVLFRVIPSHIPLRPTVTGRPAPSIYADAADDHYDEVVQHFQREWLYGTSEINALVQEKTGSPALVAELAPEGYHIDRARICELAVRNYLHMVYTDGTHEVSFFLRRRDGEQLAGPRVTTVRGKELHADSEEKLQIAGFQSQRYTVVIVSDLPMQETLRFASKAANAMPEVAAGTRHAPATLAGVSLPGE